MTGYGEIADTLLVPMNDDERHHMSRLLDEPTEDFKRLVMYFHERGSDYPKQQAALMLRNSPGVANQLLTSAGRGA